MSERAGAEIQCDGHACKSNVFCDTAARARAEAISFGWSRTEDGRDFCLTCTDRRAARKKASDLLPTGVRMMTPFEAADAAGWVRVYFDEETGEAHFSCCGEMVAVDSLIGAPYQAKCGVCGAAIADVFGPCFGQSSVSFLDSDTYDTEDPKSWVLVAEVEQARAAASTPRAGA